MATIDYLNRQPRAARTRSSEADDLRLLAEALEEADDGSLAEGVLRWVAHGEVRWSRIVDELSSRGDRTWSDTAIRVTLWPAGVGRIECELVRTDESAEEWATVVRLADCGGEELPQGVPDVR